MVSQVPFKELGQRVAKLEHLNKQQVRTNKLFETILDNILPTCVTNNNYEIIFTNKSYDTIFGSPRIGMKCYESRNNSSCLTEECPLQKILHGANKYTCEIFRRGKDGNPDRNYIVIAQPLKNSSNKPEGIIETFQDITDRKLVEKENEQLILELQEVLEEVKLLSGFLPICASCKKIRDDKGYWNQIESYISEHSRAVFSHGICPECSKKLYQEYIGSKSKE